MALLPTRWYALPIGGFELFALLCALHDLFNVGVVVESELLSCGNLAYGSVCEVWCALLRLRVQDEAR